MSRWWVIDVEKLSFITIYLHIIVFNFFFFNDTATTEIYTLSLHDALPIYAHCFEPRTSVRVVGITVTSPRKRWLAGQLAGLIQKVVTMTRAIQFHNHPFRFLLYLEIGRAHV